MQNSTSLRVLLWGTRSAFSGTVFHVLQRANVNICALFVHTPAPPWQKNQHPRRTTSFAFPQYTLAAADAPLTPSTILLDVYAAEQPASAFELGQPNLPIYEIFSLRSPSLAELMQALQPDVACVACFPQRIPPALLKLPKHGFFNVHPSLLPAHRGPAPLFWIFRSGAQATAGGVTIHRMDADFDTGDMVAQARVELPDGIAGPEAEQRCAAKGGALLAHVLADLAAGQLINQPQPVGGSYQSWPQAPDFRLDTSWPAQRAFNFMRGTAEWGVPYALDVAGEQLYLQRAVAYDAGQKLAVPAQSSGASIVQIQFAPGVLTAQKA